MPEGNSGAVAHDPYAAIRLPNCRAFLAGNLLSTVGSQMMYLGISWELYQATGSPTVLGVAGFFQVLPILLFSIPSGHLIDRHDRRKMVLIGQVLLALTSLALGLISFQRGAIPDWAVLRGANHLLAVVAMSFHETGQGFTAPYVPLILAILLLNGLVRAVNQPAKQSLLPQLVPPMIFPNAASWHSSTVEASTMIGPTAAGFMLAFIRPNDPQGLWPYSLVYLSTAILQFVSLFFFWATRPAASPMNREPVTFQSVLRGLVFVWNTRIIFATITLDLFSVVLGGATALLPLFAKEILQCGPAGLGWLRAAPSMGAIAMAMFIAHRPPMKHAGRTLLWAVAGFGVATIVFGLSRNFLLSAVALFSIGACDNVSVIVRQTLVQMLTPDSMRGRVSAVKSVFSSTSNGIGALESGLTAAMMGPRLAVVAGGIGTLLVSLGVSVFWPEMRKFGSMHDATPEPEVPVEAAASKIVLRPPQATAT